MKVACAYTGRSMSQPVLLNQLNKEVGIELHLFKDHTGNVDLIDFDYEHYSLDVQDIQIRRRTALWVTQYKLRNEWRDFLVERLNEEFDLVIGMNDVATAAVDAANVFDIPSLFFIRNLEASGQEMFSSDRGHLANFKLADFGAKVQYPFFVNNFTEYRRGMTNANRVIANSEYVSRRMKRDFDVESSVVYPPISLDEYRVEHDSGDYIAAVNPRNRGKGADIFLDLVEEMPNEEFICAGVFRDQSFRRRAEALSNLDYMGYCDDMRNFYKRAKVVIVPSRWNEAFGRSAAEPMVNGIPVVVSDRGGLPEVVGETGEVVTEINSIDAWKEAVDAALENHDPQAERKRVRRFSAETQGSRFVEIVDGIV